MTEIEVAEIIVKQDGYCGIIDCSECPAERIKRENGLESCDDLWDNDDIDEQKQWFENWLSEVKK